MLETLQSAWRGRHVLLLGTPDAVRFTLAALAEIGADASLLPPLSSAQALCRAMTRARLSAVVVPRAQELCAPDGDIPASLSRLQTVLAEAREAGVPLVIAATDAPVYRPLPRPARESDPLGGLTAEGLTQALFALYAGGVSRGLAGDAVRTLWVCHAPPLGGGSPLVRQYARWCDALLDGDVLCVEHPAAQGIFAHPAEIACALLLLGARCLEDAQGGAYNVGLSPACLCANRTAARRLAAESGGKRPLRESEPPLTPAQPLDGSAAQALCGAVCRLRADESLSLLLALRRAGREGEDALAREVAAQTRRVLGGA